MIQDMIEAISEVILNIGDGEGDPFDIARQLYCIIEQYGTGSDCTDILEQFSYKTGVSLND